MAEQVTTVNVLSQKSSNTPTVRIKDFENEWEPRTLGSLGSTFSGLSGKSKADFGHGSGGYVTYMGVFSNPLSDESMTGRIEVDASQTEVRFGDVFFTTSSETPEDVGMSSVWVGDKENIYLNSFCFGFRPTHPIDHLFLAYVLRGRKFRGKISFLAQGISRFNISKRKAMELEMLIPGEDEQARIGSYFQSLDQTISLHRRKHEKLVTLKQAMLQKMFPQDDATTPEIRFKGFDGEWSKAKFGESTTPLSSNTLSRADLNYDCGHAKNVHYGDVLIRFGSVLDANDTMLPFVTDPNAIEKLGVSKLQDGDIVIADASEDEAVGKCVELFNVGDQIVLAGLHTIAVRPLKPFARFYLGYFLNSNSYHNQLLPLMQGTKVLSVSKTTLRDTVLQYPRDLAEQAKIGSYFRNLDTLITKHAIQIEKLKNIKAACLDKMFV